MPDRDRARLDSSLRRIDVLIEAIEAAPESSAREPARELIEIVLDLHALALARIMAAAAACEDRRLLSTLAEDAQIKAMLLLHGLHPEEAETRVRRALDRLRPQLGVQGVGIQGGRVAVEAGRLVVHVFAQAGGDGEQRRAWRREIEQALLDAAPDLEEIVIVGLDDDVESPASLDNDLSRAAFARG
jgi:hypothetical protein